MKLSDQEKAYLTLVLKSLQFSAQQKDARLMMDLTLSILEKLSKKEEPEVSVELS